MLVTSRQWSASVHATSQPPAKFVRDWQPWNHTLLDISCICLLARLLALLTLALLTLYVHLVPVQLPGCLLSMLSCHDGPCFP